jgi:hypothetical protein
MPEPPGRSRRSGISTSQMVVVIWSAPSDDAWAARMLPGSQPSKGHPTPVSHRRACAIATAPGDGPRPTCSPIATGGSGIVVARQLSMLPAPVPLGGHTTMGKSRRNNAVGSTGSCEAAQRHFEEPGSKSGLRAVWVGGGVPYSTSLVVSSGRRSVAIAPPTRSPTGSDKRVSWLGVLRPCAREPAGGLKLRCPAGRLGQGRYADRQLTVVRAGDCVSYHSFVFEPAPRRRTGRTRPDS